MPRKKVVLSNQLPYHVTGRANNREWFALPEDKCWSVFSDYLYFAAKIYELRIHAFVLMPNHFHLLCSTPTFFISEIMNRFMTELSFAINDLSGRTNHVFGSRYHGSIIEDPYYFANVTKYIYQNPLKAKLCETAETYPWSTLSRVFGAGNIYFPVVPFTPFAGVLPADEVKYLKWLNTLFSQDHSDLIKKALTRGTFHIPAKEISSPGYALRVSLN